MVGLKVYLGGGPDIIQSVTTDLIDIPLAIRTARDAKAYLTNLAQKQHQQELEKSKEVKPVL